MVANNERVELSATCVIAYKLLREISLRSVILVYRAGKEAWMITVPFLLYVTEWKLRGSVKLAKI